MINLNIIPKALKKEIKLKLIYKLLKQALYFLLISLVFYSTVFLFSYFLLRQHFSENTQKKVLTMKSNENYSQKVKEINERIKFISNIQAETINWSKFIQHLSQNINNGIKLSRLTLSKKDNTAVITGQADTRDSLIAFKSWLENSEYLDEINLPIQNLLEKENINFTIRAKIKSYEFN